MTPEERADEERVRAALRAAGIDDQDFGFFAGRDIPEAEIFRPRFDFEAAAPVLVEMLPEVETAAVKETIVRSVTSQQAATPRVLKPLIREFRAATDVGLKWAVGNALASLADASVVDDLIELARDGRHGSTREMLMDALARTKENRALEALVELVDDDEVAGHAISALRRLGPKSSVGWLERARPALERQAEHGRTPLARKQAAAALAFMGSPSRRKIHEK